jgi:hypothetical protein
MCSSVGGWIEEIWSMYTMEYYSELNNWDYAIWWEMDETGECHVK